MCRTSVVVLWLGAAVHANAAGLTAQWYHNTALAGPAGDQALVAQLTGLPTCHQCGQPSSLLISGRVAPPRPGNFGFALSFTPPLAYPSPEAYARLWVHDHLLYPKDTAGYRQGSDAPLWIPLPARALDKDGRPVQALGAANLSSYELRLEYVCLAAAGCGSRSLSLEWTTFDQADNPLKPWAAIATEALMPSQGPAEQMRRALAARMETGWGTFYHASMLAWVLLPESFVVKAGLYQISTGAYLPSDGLTVNPALFHQFAIRPGLHSYDQSYIEASITWRAGDVNISLATTVDRADSSELTMVATVNNCKQVNASDYLLILEANFTHGRAGTVTASEHSIRATSAGLRSAELSLVQGVALVPSSTTGLPEVFLSVQLADTPVVLSTDKAMSGDQVLTKTAAYRREEAVKLLKYGDWSEVTDAMQTSLMWSLIYDPREGLVAPVTRNWNFGQTTVDGDTSAGLFCWDGSFASYMLSLDALDLALLNLIQIVKGRTSAGFIPSLHDGTMKSRDRSNPPVTAKILQQIVGRWGLNRTGWAVELLFEDLRVWNDWMWAARREAPLGLLSWGSDPYRYAPDKTGSAQGTGAGGASLESGLDNGPVMEGLPFNSTGLYLQDEYDAGLTGMFLMDCQAQSALAQMIGRTEAAAELDARFSQVNKVMLTSLWNETAGYFQNKRSADMSPVERMAPTHFYPMLAGPGRGPSDSQVTATVTQHLTNPARFAVWPSASPPEDHPVPPDEARPLVQWLSKVNGTHVLCCQLRCNFDMRANTKLRYEGIGLAAIPAVTPSSALLPLYNYSCGPNQTDMTMAPAEWKPANGGPCIRIGGTGSQAALFAYRARTGPSAADLVPLQMWYAPGDHYITASAQGRSDALARGYVQAGTFGFVHPAPGSENATSRWGLPSISRDDSEYIDQNYWHGRIWSPMIQIVYWGLEQYKDNAAARGAAEGLVAQSKALLLKEWRGYGGVNSYAGSGRYVYENFGADTGEGYGYSSEAQPLYSWGALAGFVGMQAAGMY